MSDFKEVLDRARTEAQELHKKIEASTAKNHAALRTDIANAAAQAQKLADSLKTVAQGQRDDAKQHLKDAVSQLEDVAKHAHAVADANETQLKETNRAILQKTRDAAASLSHAIAEQRSAVAKAIKH